MGLLSVTQNCGLRMRWEYRERFPHHRGLVIPTCITARVWRTRRDACLVRYLVVSFEVGVEGNIPGIPGACATHTLTYLVRGPVKSIIKIAGTDGQAQSDHSTTIAGVVCFIIIGILVGVIVVLVW